MMREAATLTAGVSVAKVLQCLNVGSAVDDKRELTAKAIENRATNHLQAPSRFVPGVQNSL